MFLKNFVESSSPESYWSSVGGCSSGRTDTNTHIIDFRSRTTKSIISSAIIICLFSFSWFWKVLIRTPKLTYVQLNMRSLENFVESSSPESSKQVKKGVKAFFAKYEARVDLEFIDLRTLDENRSLYLAQEAVKYIDDIEGFHKKLSEIAVKLDVPKEWLMAVMYSESKFNHKAYNHKGSGAVGLIQFMPSTLRDLNRRFGTKYTTKEIETMGPVAQLDVVYLYLNAIKKAYGDYQTVTDLYLGILYPKARKKARTDGEDYSLYTKWGKPTTYRQNSGLDKINSNWEQVKDGRVTIADIDYRMAKLFPTAYRINKMYNED